MKPCSNNRKLISWLALGVLDAQETREIRAHLATCEGCRGYLDEISNVTTKLTAAEIDLGIHASESFHQKVIHRLRAEEPVSVWEAVIAYLRTTLLNWRVGLPLIGATAVAIAALFFAMPRSGVSPSASSSALAVSKQDAGKDLEPTIANYQMVANRSLDEFDQLLTREANKTRSPMPIYRASAFSQASLSD